VAGNIQRRPDGKWRARYRDTNHREHARHFPRKRDAERWLASQEVAIARGEWVDPTLSKITVGEWLPQWLARQVQLKPTTMVRYEVALRRQILPRWEFVALAKITHSDVSSWVHSLTDRGLAKAPGDLVFTAPEGGVLRNTNFRPRFFDPAAEKAGLPGLTPHELRHTAASLAVAAGANVKAVQQMLGHASAAMTLDVYAGLFADDLDQVADQLDRAFTKLNADQMRTARHPSQPNQGVLPFENSPEHAAG
jgi:hypothetical protein